jgi:hypothetical protein
MSNVRRVYLILPSSKTIAETHKKIAEPFALQASKSTLRVTMTKEKSFKEISAFSSLG